MKDYLYCFYLLDLFTLFNFLFIPDSFSSGIFGHIFGLAFLLFFINWYVLGLCNFELALIFCVFFRNSKLELVFCLQTTLPKFPFLDASTQSRLCYFIYFCICWWKHLCLFELISNFTIDCLSDLFIWFWFVFCFFIIGCFEFLFVGWFWFLFVFHYFIYFELFFVRFLDGFDLRLYGNVIFSLYHIIFCYSQLWIVSPGPCE